MIFSFDQAALAYDSPFQGSKPLLCMSFANCSVGELKEAVYILHFASDQRELSNLAQVHGNALFPIAALGS